MGSIYLYSAGEMSSNVVVCTVDEELEDCTVEELRESLPTHQPRFVAYSFCHNHNDGRVSYPMVFLFSSPPGGQTELSVMYAGSKTNLVRETGMTKLLEVRDMEDLK